jgi:peptidoglycan-associated lipoprotein
MKINVKLFSLAFVAAALVLSGCTKKPVRPTPDQTMMGPQTGGTVTPMAVETPTTVDQNSQLQPRTDGVLEDEFTIRGLLQPVYFDFDKSTIKQSERSKLEAAVDYLKKNPAHRLLLEGHCDWRGTVEYNLGLGDRRAGASKQYVLKLGVDAKKLETLSKGSLDAVKSGTDEQMGKDRRVDLVILKK